MTNTNPNTNTNHRAVYIASDHAGFSLKQHMITSFPWGSYGLEIIDLGPNNDDESVDYPDYAHSLCDRVISDSNQVIGKTKGILICGSGVGVSIAANRHNGIRAAVLHNENEAIMARRHNDINIACFAGRTIGKEFALKLLALFLETEFEGGRHQRRVEKIDIDITKSK